MNVVEDIRPIEGNETETYEDHVNFLPLFSSQIDENSISTPTSDNRSTLNLESSVRSEECNDLQADSEIEVEKIPAWIRYLPKTNFSKSHRSKGETCSKSVEKSHRLLVKVKQRPSSNPLGSTSIKATATQTKERSSQPSSTTLSLNSKLTKERLKSSCNVNEAAMLFSMSGISK